MPHSSTVSTDGWRGTAAAASLGILAVFSAVVLFSFGAQVIVAPALLPAQWLIARHTRGVTSMMFSALGALLAAELVWIATSLFQGEGVSTLVGVTVVAAGLLAGFVFFKTSRPADDG